MKKKILIITILSIMSVISYVVCKSESNDFRLNFESCESIEYQSNSGNIADYHKSSFSASEHEIYVPRQTSFSGPNRIQTNVKRTNVHTFRPHSALLKGGKSVKTNTSSINKSEFFRFPSGFSEYTHHLISLGKLII